MEDNKIQHPQDNNTIITVAPDKDKENQPEIQKELKKTNKKKIWIVVGVVTGSIAIIGIIIGALIINGVFSCPLGQHISCVELGGGEDLCRCTSNTDNEHVDILKPIIYLYPKEETNITVQLGNPEKLTSSYPRYTDGWNVIAYPNGDLIDKETGNKLYSLYWEGEEDDKNIEKTVGFIVKGTDSTGFLEEKLEILGLNYKEKEEFIVYWLPKLEAHKYNYIYFATEEEIEKEMPLELSVKPDTLIRVRMIFEGLNEYKEVEEQKLVVAPERNGFTVVEWGGTDLTRQ